MAKVPNGENVQALADHGEYFHIRWQGIEGFARWTNLRPAIDLWEKSSLVQFMQVANIKLIRAEWLVKAANLDLTDEEKKRYGRDYNLSPPDPAILRMRQDLPEEAFVPEDELMIRSITSASHAWQSAAHPDPTGYAAKSFAHEGKLCERDRKRGRAGSFF